MTAEQKATAKKALGITVQIAALLVITLQYAKSFSTPAMSAIGAAYAPAGVDSLMLKNIEGLPSLMAIVGAFAVGILERYMKKKTMLIIAMTCTLVGGVVAGLMPETIEGFYGILACRVVLGLSLIHIYLRDEPGIRRCEHHRHGEGGYSGCFARGRRRRLPRAAPRDRRGRGRRGCR